MSTALIPANAASAKTRNRLHHLLQDINTDPTSMSNLTANNNSSASSPSSPNTASPWDNSNNNKNNNTAASFQTQLQIEDALIKQRVTNALNGLTGARLRKLLVPCMWLRVWRRRKAKLQQEARNQALQLEEPFSSGDGTKTSSSSNNNNNYSSAFDEANNSNKQKHLLQRTALTSFFTSSTRQDQSYKDGQSTTKFNPSPSSGPTSPTASYNITNTPTRLPPPPPPSKVSSTSTTTIASRVSYRVLACQTLLNSSFAFKAIGEAALRNRCTGRDGIDEGAVLEMLHPLQILLHAYEPAQATGVIVLLSGTLAVSTSCREAWGRGPEPGEPASDVNYFIHGPAAIFPDRVFTEALLPYFVVSRSNCEVAYLSHRSMMTLIDSHLSPLQQEKLTSCVLRERAHSFKQNFSMTVSLFRSISWLVQGLPDKVVMNLISRMLPVSFFPNGQIFNSGTATDVSLFLRRGKIEITMLLTKEQILSMESKQGSSLNGSSNNINNDTNSVKNQELPSQQTEKDNNITAVPPSSSSRQGSFSSSTLANRRFTGSFSNSVVVANINNADLLLATSGINNNNQSLRIAPKSSASIRNSNNDDLDDNDAHNTESPKIKSKVSFIAEADDSASADASLRLQHEKRTYIFEAPLSLGELGLVLGEKRIISAKALTFVDGWQLRKEELDHFLVDSRTSAAKITTTAIQTREEWLKSHKNVEFLKKAIKKWIPGIVDSDEEKPVRTSSLLSAFHNNHQPQSEGTDTTNNNNTKNNNNNKNQINNDQQRQPQFIDYNAILLEESQEQNRKSLIDDIIDALEPCVVPSRTPIAALSDFCNGFYIVVRGRLSEQRRRSYAASNLRFGPGSVVGECCALRHRWAVPVCSTARADCWRLSSGKFCQLLRKHGRLQAILAASEMKLRELCDAVGADPPPQQQHQQISELKPNWTTVLDDHRIKDPDAELDYDFSDDDDEDELVHHGDGRGGGAGGGASGRWKLSSSKGVPMETHQFEPDINFGIAAQKEVKSLVKALSETPTSRQRCIMRALDGLGLVSQIDKPRIRTPVQVRRRRRMDARMLMMASTNGGGGGAGGGGLDNEFIASSGILASSNNNVNNESKIITAMDKSSINNNNKSVIIKDPAAASSANFSLSADDTSGLELEEKKPKTKEEKIIAMIRRKMGERVTSSDDDDPDSNNDPAARNARRRRRLLIRKQQQIARGGGPSLQEMMKDLRSSQGIGLKKGTAIGFAGNIVEDEDDPEVQKRKARERSLSYAAALLGKGGDDGGGGGTVNPDLLIDDDDDAEDNGTIGGIIPSIPEYREVHLLPHVAMTISTAEKLGYTAPALFALLERPSRFTGVMEGSEPGAYDILLPKEGDDDFFTDEDFLYYNKLKAEHEKEKMKVGASGILGHSARNDKKSGYFVRSSTAYDSTLSDSEGENEEEEEDELASSSSSITPSIAGESSNVETTQNTSITNENAMNNTDNSSPREVDAEGTEEEQEGNKSQQQRQISEAERRVKQLASEEKQRQKQIEKERRALLAREKQEKHHRRRVEKQKRKMKILIKRKRQREMFSSPGSGATPMSGALRSFLGVPQRTGAASSNNSNSYNNNNKSVNISYSRSSNNMNAFSSLNGTTGSFDNNNNPNASGFDVDNDLAAELLPAALFGRRQRKAEVNYKPKRPHSYEAQIPSSVAQAEERRRVLHANFQKKMKEDEDALVSAREKAVRFLRQQQHHAAQQQHQQEQQEHRRRDTNKNGNNSGQQPVTIVAFDETSPISDRELLTVLLAEKDLADEISKEAPPELMDAAIREEDARQKNPAAYEQTLKHQQLETTRLQVEREMCRIAPKTEYTHITTAINILPDYSSNQQNSNNNNNRRMSASASSSFLELSSYRHLQNDGRSKGQLIKKRNPYQQSHVADPHFQEINDILPEELHDHAWEAKRLEMIRDVSQQERETRPYLPEFRVRQKKWVFVSHRPQENNNYMKNTKKKNNNDECHDDDDAFNHDDDAFEETNSNIAKEDHPSNENTMNNNNNENTTTTINEDQQITARRSPLLSSDATTSTFNDHNNNNNTKRRESSNSRHGSQATTTNVNTHDHDNDDEGRSSPDQETTTEQQNENQQNNSNHKNNNNNPPAGLQKRKNVPRYARPTLKNSYMKLAEILNNKTSKEHQHQHPQESSLNTTAKPPHPPSPKNQNDAASPNSQRREAPKVLIKTKPSASIGCSSTLILPANNNNNKNNNHSSERKK